jgi:PIN like domain
VTHSTPSRPDPTELLAALPHAFVDRSLGALQVPSMLREAGFSLTTMREHYGEAEAQHVADVEWITLTAERGWIGFHKDAEIRRNEVERRAVVATGARMFCVPRADITAADLAARYITNLAAIAAATTTPGPYIYSVQAHRIVRLPL